MITSELEHRAEDAFNVLSEYAFAEACEDLGIYTFSDSPDFQKDAATKDAFFEAIFALKKRMLPKMAEAYISKLDIPRVTVDVRFQKYIPALHDACIDVGGTTFDATFVLERIADELVQTNELDRLIFIDEDGEVQDLEDFELLDEIYRDAQAYGIVESTNFAFECTISSGWEAWAKNRYLRETAGNES